MKKRQSWSITFLSDRVLEGGWGLPLNLLLNCRIGLILEGEAVWTVNGTPHRVQAGDVVILKPGTVRSAKAIRRFRHVAACLTWDAEAYNLEAPPPPEEWPPWFSALPPVVSPGVSEVRRLVGTLRTAQAEGEMGLHHSAELADALIRQFFIRLFRAAHHPEFVRPHGAKGDAPPGRGIPLPLVRALEYLHVNLHRTVTMDRLSEVAGYSQVQLRRLFRKYLGISPQQYLTRIRIGRAEALLQNRDLTVAEVAQYVGYSDPFHFSRRFKSYTGMSPSVYAARHRERPRTCLDTLSHSTDPHIGCPLDRGKLKSRSVLGTGAG